MLALEGAARLDRAALGVLAPLESALSDVAPAAAGTRLWGRRALAALVAPGGPIGALAQRLLPAAQPVRALLFNKAPGSNWALGWHQDRVIAVRARHDVPGYGPWTVKAGVPHVEPPFAILSGMITLRVHLDRVGDKNAPLLVALGSHRLGRIADGAIAGAVATSAIKTCLAERGDVWAYATPILHASDAARQPSARRVLHIDYSSAALPPPLAWRGV